MMEPKWDSSEKRWTASTGSGSNRRWAKCRIPGHEGYNVCLQKLRKLEAEIEGPPPLIPGSFAEFVEEVWWPRVKKREKSTQRSYRQKMESHLHPFFPVQIASIDLRMVQEWVDEMEEKPRGGKGGHAGGDTLSAKTIKDTYAVLTNVLGMAKVLGKTKEESWRLAELPEIEVREPVRLETEELKKLLAYVEGHWLEGAIWATAMFGFRKGEMLGLKVTDVVLEGDAYWVYVRSQRGVDGEKQKLKNKKKGYNRRFRISKPWGEKLLSFTPPGSMYIFCDRSGNPIYQNRPTKEFPKLCEEATGRRVCFKDLRSTCASLLKDLGVSQETRMDILGHTTVEAHEKYLKDNGAQTLTATSRLEVI